MDFRRGFSASHFEIPPTLKPRRTPPVLSGVRWNNSTPSASWSVILRSSTQHMNKLPGPGLTFVEHWKGQRGSVREHAKSGHCHANFKLIQHPCHLKFLHSIDKKRPHVFMPGRARLLVRNTGRHQDGLDQDGFWVARRAFLSHAPREDIRRRCRRDRQSSDTSFRGGPCGGHGAGTFRFVARLHLDQRECAWFAPANPSYEAIGFPSAGFDLVPNGG
jgi:hypothetical protein